MSSHCEPIVDRAAEICDLDHTPIICCCLPRRDRDILVSGQAFLKQPFSNLPEREHRVRTQLSILVLLSMTGCTETVAPRERTTPKATATPERVPGHWRPVGPAEAAVVCPATGLRFPKKAGLLPYRFVQRYKGKGLGYSVRYQASRRSWGDVYVYQLGFSSNQLRGTDSLLKRQLLRAESSIKYIVRRGLYSHFQKLRQGVVTMARDRGKYVLWFDSNGYGIAPGTVVGSCILKNDRAAYQTVKQAIEGTLPYGQPITVGVREGYIDFIGDDDHYRRAVPEALRLDMAERVERYKTGAQHIAMPAF